MQIRMLVVQGKDHGKCLRFPIGEFLFGRGSECHIQPNSPSVSRQHCLLCVTADEIMIRDLGSTNGTLVNGMRLVGEKRLRTGDRLQFGALVLQLLDDRPFQSISSDTVTEAAAQGDTVHSTDEQAERRKTHKRLPKKTARLDKQRNL